ncbi:MAG: PAS domain-containing protein [Planctomycetes bacterium]|nr:PAS domain-containing protein [Planctomycetota bacterium]
MTPASQQQLPELDLERAMRDLESLGASLTTSYRSLEERARRVEQELAVANRELARKVAELDEVKAGLEAVLAALPTGVLVRDADGHIVRANAAALVVLGVDESAVLGRESTEFDGRDDEWIEHEAVRPDGSRRVVASRRSVVARDLRAGGEPAGTVEILDDRTRVVELSERLHAMDKLTAMGDMASGIAHELRNPMMAVKGFAEMLAPRLPEGSNERRWAGMIVEGSAEAETILASMMSLASPDKLALDSVDAHELARAALRLARLGAERDGVCPVELTTTVDCPTFSGDRIKLRQALRNLLANAIQAQPRGGRVHLAIAREGDEVVARVQDAGPGISQKLARRVFEPFFTTRAEGTGLGLALVQRIAVLHGGRVEISSLPSPFGGAEVRLHLPFRN